MCFLDLSHHEVCITCYDNPKLKHCPFCRNPIPRFINGRTSPKYITNILQNITFEKCNVRFFVLYRLGVSRGALDAGGPSSAHSFSTVSKCIHKHNFSFNKQSNRYCLQYFYDRITVYFNLC